MKRPTLLEGWLEAGIEGPAVAAHLAISVERLIESLRVDHLTPAFFERDEKAPDLVSIALNTPNVHRLIPMIDDAGNKTFYEHILSRRDRVLRADDSGHIETFATNFSERMEMLEVDARGHAFADFLDSIGCDDFKGINEFLVEHNYFEDYPPNLIEGFESLLRYAESSTDRPEEIWQAIRIRKGIILALNSSIFDFPVKRRRVEYARSIRIHCQSQIRFSELVEGIQIFTEHEKDELLQAIDLIAP